MKKTSEILKEIVSRCEQPGPISVGEFLNLLGDRAFCLAILVFSLPNSLPVPGIPGFSTVTGVPIIFMAAQMVMGRQVIWLPAAVANKSFSRAMLGKLIEKALPSIIWLEKFLRPSWEWLVEGFGERVVGLFILVLALILSLPIPGGNFLPGVSMSLLCLCMLEKDGKKLAVALAAGVASFVVMLKVVTAFFGWLFKLLSGWWAAAF